MSKTLFTPGPWAAQIENDPSDPEHRFCIEVKGVSDPDSYEWVASVHQQFKGRLNGEANARLIAAAPEMFELLERLSELHPDGNPLNIIKEAQSLLTRITTADRQ